MPVSRLYITMPRELKKELDKKARQKHLPRSTFIQRVLKYYFDFLEKRENAKLLSEGYAEMAGENKKLLDEFEALDKDSLKYVP